MLRMIEFLLEKKKLNISIISSIFYFILKVVFNCQVGFTNTIQVIVLKVQVNHTPNTIIRRVILISNSRLIDNIQTQSYLTLLYGPQLTRVKILKEEYVFLLSLYFPLNFFEFIYLRVGLKIYIYIYIYIYIFILVSPFIMFSSYYNLVLYMLDFFFKNFC